MNKLLTFIALVLLGTVSFAQPINDDCTGIIDLGDAPICPSPAIYTNFLATESNIGNDNFPNCFNGNPVRDVWFQFNAVSGIEDYVITVTGTPDAMGSTPMLMPQVALYRGDACAMDELVLLDCADANPGDGEVSFLTTGLTAGITYYLRINDWTLSTPNWGSFSLCVEEFVQTVFTIDEGGANVCSGELYDTGGPNQNYGNNENFVFIICPDDPHTCINFTLESYNVQNQNDVITFYDGNTIFGPVVGEIDGGGNGLGHGGVCYPVTATSGCLTVHFQSDGFQNFQGFYGTWECSNDCPEDSPLDVNADATIAEIEAAFQSPLMDVSVTSINCPNGAYGTFLATDDTGLGMNEGLLLTTGLAENASNPATILATTDHNATGDPDLNYLHDTYGNGFGQVNDACWVEMDVTPKWNRVGFDYIFGSDEYKQNGFSPFSNDMMAIMISGTGIAGEPGLNNQEHLTFFPGNALVQIATVNSNTRWEYYRNNEENKYIVYNGLTSDFLGSKKTLTAEKVLTPCETYKVKMAIGDTDPDDDSGLFVAPTKEGIPVLSVNYNTGIDYLVEGCTDTESTVEINLPNAVGTTLVIQVGVGGTATQNQDFTGAIPTQIIFQPGQTNFSFPISVLDDNIAEGTETIEFSLTSNFGCGEVLFSELTIEIKDALEVEIIPSEDTVFVCDGIFTANLAATGGATYQWTPGGVFDNSTAQNPTATVSNDQTVTVTGSLGSCSASDEVFLQIVSPEVNIDQVSITLCEGETLQLSSSNNVDNSGLTWSPSFGLDDPTSPNPIATPNFTTTYTLSVETESGGCMASDEIMITVEPFDFPKITVSDTLICENSSVVLAEPVFNSSTIFEWTPTDGLNFSTIPNATATPDVPTTYTLTATSINGLCTETAQVHIDVFPADVVITNPDTIKICLGDTIALNSITSTSGLGLTWTPADSLSSTTDENVLAFPEFSTWYYANLEVGDCLVRDSVFIQVDSLPDLTIQAIPDKDMYCEGEIISLATQGYPVSRFPDIAHAWIPAPGAISEDTLLNLVINATQTFTYTRYSVNHACEDTAQIEIIVVPTAEITIVPEDPIVCPGETVQLVASSPDITEFEWSPGAGLSCTDCPNPVVNPPGTITYQVSGEFMGCPANAVVTVEEEPAPNFDLTDENIACVGETLLLNDVDDPNATYVWTLTDGTVFSNESMPSYTFTQTETITLSITNGDCPPTESSFTVNVPQESDLTLSVNGESLICQGASVELVAEIATQGGIFAWAHDATLEGSNITVTPDLTTTYSVLYTAPKSCFTKEAEVVVNVELPFTIDSLIADPECVFEREELLLEVITNPPTLNGATYEWDEEGIFLNTTDVNNFTIRAQELTDNDPDSIDIIYNVFITDAAGCTGGSAVVVTVKDSFDEIPNAFTPDGDGHNDFFGLLKSDNVEVIDFRVWNRWGQMVYDNESNDAGWDGNQDGKPAASDVYVYSIKYLFGDTEKSIQGEVTLLR